MTDTKTLVERLREVDFPLVSEAADRLEELERERTESAANHNSKTVEKAQEITQLERRAGEGEGMKRYLVEVYIVDIPENGRVPDDISEATEDWLNKIGKQKCFYCQHQGGTLDEIAKKLKGTGY